jgi:hypothetical protein
MTFARTKRPGSGARSRLLAAVVIMDFGSASMLADVSTGADIGRDCSAFGEEANARRLGRVLDTGAAILASLCMGELVTHRGALVAEGGGDSRPGSAARIPLWFGTAHTTGRPAWATPVYGPPRLPVSTTPSCWLVVSTPRLSRQRLRFRASMPWAKTIGSGAVSRIHLIGV